MSALISDTGFAARQKSYDLLVAKVDDGKVLTPSEMTTMTRFEQEKKEAGLVDLPERFSTPDQVAEYAGYKVRTVYNAVSGGKLVRMADNSFLRADVDKWLATKGRLPQVASFSSADSPADDDEPKTNSARFEETRYRKARADKEELLVARLQEKLMEVAEGERQFVNRAHEYKTSLLLLSRRCSHKIAAAAGVEIKVVSDVLDEEVKILLKTLSRKVKIHDN